jgi:glycosyltransferase involved in cell wall biosynthesis
MVFSPALLHALAGKKVIWTLHDENAFTGGCHYAGSCRSFQARCYNCPLLKRSGPDDASARCFRLKEQLYPLLNPSLVTPSAWLAEKVKASTLLGNYSVSAIPNPLNMEDFQPPQDRRALREKLGLPEDAFVILSGCEDLGNARKNIKALFEALALLSGRSPDVPVVIMLYGNGQPPDLAFPVHHFGYVADQAAMAELCGAADLFVHTALQDNLPLTLCEAQAYGTPTLSFAVGGCPETMLPGKTGFLVAETSARALAEKLREIIAARGNLAGMRTAARAFAEERFDPHAVAAAYTEVFEKTQAAPGLKSSEPLFAELVQNQIASLASFLHDANQEQTTQHEALRQQHEALHQELNALRWNLRHPFRWFFRKLRQATFIWTF